MNEVVNIKELNAHIEQESIFVETLRKEIGRVIVGQQHLVDTLLIGLLSGGHILLEGVPGLAKTLAITTLSKAVDAKFARIQFTPDLLPADLIGTLIYSQRNEEFTVKRGPIFANFILADEINRSPAKVQSALLEAMQEKQVTIGDTTYALPEPFLVLATQNPLEQEGTYPLPEAQVDRFMFKCLVETPSKSDERRIMERFAQGAKAPEAETVATPEAIASLRDTLKEVYCDEKVGDYILDIVFATREPENVKGLESLKEQIQVGASPRATLALNKAARANALVNGRAYATPQDVKAVVYDVLRHRILLTYEAEAENMTTDQIISEIINAVEVP